MVGSFLAHFWLGSSRVRGRARSRDKPIGGRARGRVLIWLGNPTLAEIDDRRAVARRLFDALCAQYPDKYIALIQPRDVANELLPAPKTSASK